MNRIQGASVVRAAPPFAALGDETRLEIVARLAAPGPQFADGRVAARGDEASSRARG